MKNAPLTQALSNAGGPAALAAQLNITSQAISQWRRVPAERALEVEAITGVSRHELRPDVFGPPPAPEPAQ